MARTTTGKKSSKSRSSKAPGPSARSKASGRSKSASTPAGKKAAAIHKKSASSKATPAKTASARTGRSAGAAKSKGKASKSPSPSAGKAASSVKKTATKSAKTAPAKSAASKDAAPKNTESKKAQAKNVESKNAGSKGASTVNAAVKAGAPKKGAAKAQAAAPAEASKPAKGAKATAASASAAKPAKPTKSAPVLKLGGKKVRTVAEAASNIAADSKGYVFINGRRVRMISLKGQPLPPKKSRTNGAAASPEQEETDAAAIRAIKTKLTRKELNHYRELLLVKRRQIVGDLSAIEHEALRSGGGNLSHMPIHMADIGTDTFDQDFMLGQAESERKALREIDAALQRIEDGTYGVCQMTGMPIPKARLDANPWAKYTVEAARKLEGQWGR